MWNTGMFGGDGAFYDMQTNGDNAQQHRCMNEGLWNVGEDRGRRCSVLKAYNYFL